MRSAFILTLKTNNKMKNQNKYNYLNVIQQNYGQGWEDVSEYEATSQGVSVETFYTTSPSPITGRKVKISLCRHDFKKYCLMGYPTRIIFRKELKEQLQTV